MAPACLHILQPTERTFTVSLMAILGYITCFIGSLFKKKFKLRLKVFEYFSSNGVLIEGCKYCITESEENRESKFQKI